MNCKQEEYTSAKDSQPNVWVIDYYACFRHVIDNMTDLRGKLVEGQ